MTELRPKCGVSGNLIASMFNDPPEYSGAEFCKFRKRYGAVGHRQVKSGKVRAPSITSGTESADPLWSHQSGVMGARRRLLSTASIDGWNTKPVVSCCIGTVIETP